MTAEPARRCPVPQDARRERLRFEIRPRPEPKGPPLTEPAIWLDETFETHLAHLIAPRRVTLRAEARLVVEARGIWWVRPLPQGGAWEVPALLRALRAAMVWASDESWETVPRLAPRWQIWRAEPRGGFGPEDHKIQALHLAHLGQRSWVSAGLDLA